MGKVSPNESPSRAAGAAIAHQLEAAGCVAYFAGGCVRDELLGELPLDYDVATSALPDQIRELFPGARGVGEHFGVMLVRQGGQTIEVSTFRKEGAYVDGRRPEHVSFTTDEVADANRRDFTINGIFKHPATGKIIDHFGGEKDLKARVLRAIGDPDARLSEDRLRLLRAVRFTARFHMTIDPATEQAIARHAPELRGVSRERVGHEVRRMLTHATRAKAVHLLESLGLASATLLEPPCANVGSRVASLPADASFSCALAAWLLDRGMALPWQERVRQWTKALVLSNHERDELAATLRARETLMGDWSKLGVAKRKRVASDHGFTDAMMVLRCESPQIADRIEIDLAPLRASGLAPTPLLDGDILQQIGMRPGPHFRSILDGVYDAQLEGRITTLEQAKALARANPTNL